MYTIIIVTLIMWGYTVYWEIKHYEDNLQLIVFKCIMNIMYCSWFGIIFGSLISIFFIKEETATTITKYKLEQLYKCGADSLYIEINDENVIYKVDNNLMVVGHPKVEFNYDSVNFTVNIYKTDKTDAIINNFTPINYTPKMRYVFRVPKESIKRDLIN